MRNILRTLSNSKGISMIQALVGSFIASVIALGVSTMMVNSKIQTRKIQLFNTLSEQKMRLEFLMRDQNAFSQTINNNTNAIFTALKASSPVTEVSYATGGQKTVLYDSAGNAVFDLLGPVASGLTGNGITEKGNPCTGFNGNAGSGNDDCPISYRILVGADCPASGTTCTDPQLKLVARMMYNPSPSGNSQLRKFATLLPQRVWNAVSSDSIEDSVEDLKYDAVVKRTASTISKGFQLAVMHPNLSASGPAATGCQTGSYANHRYLAAVGWQQETDPHNLVTMNSGGLGRFVINDAGYYQCSISVPAFAVDGFTIKLRNISAGSDAGIGSSFAPRWSEAVAKLETSMNVVGGQAFEIHMMCDNNGYATQWALGVSREATYNTPFPMVTIICTKVDTAF